MRTQSPLTRWNDRLGHGSAIHLSFFADVLRPIDRCCAEPRLALSNHPRRWTAWGDRGAGAMVGAFTLRTEAISRGARMLRTALGPAIAAWLEDPGVVEVMLNPDGRLWVDRLTEGLIDTGERLAAADGERIVRLVAHHVGAAAQRPYCGWNFDREDHACQCVARRGRQDDGPRRPDRRHARAPVQDTQSRGAANQGRGRLAVRSRALLAPATTGSHPDRRGARRRSARSPEGVGHWAPRRNRNHSCRLGTRRAASPGATHPGSRRHRAAGPHRGDDRLDCRARLSRA